MSSVRRLSIVLLLAAAACQEEKPPSLPSALSVTAEASSVKANGVATVFLNVSGSTLGPITVTASRGTFVDSGDRQTVIPGVAGTVELRTCDATAAGCAGTVHVTATDGKSAVGAATLTFVGFETCTNLVDDNGDGLVDCADPDCAAATCRTGAGAVGACVDAACVCNASGPAETACSDGADDDCDGAVDCADTDCAGDACVAAGGAIGACSAAGTCVCTPQGATETSCGDGKDNDCDGAVDCADAECGDRACQTASSGPGTCQTGTCQAVSCVPAGAESCTGGLDEDCDELVDCADDDCDGRACSATVGFACMGGACTDMGTGFSLEVAPARTALPADGAAQTNVSIRVLQAGAPVAGVAVAVAADLGGLSAASVTTDAEGVGEVVFTAAAAAGRATITATLATPPMTATATIALPALGAIELPEDSTPGLQYAVMGVKGSGFREQNQITVRVVDADQKPYPAGLAVRLEHHELAGSLLSRTPETDAACAGSCMFYVARTDDQGLARVNLYSGTKAGTLGVVASAAAGGEDRNFALPTVAVIGARANAGAFTVACDPVNVPAFHDHDCGVSLVASEFTCVAVLQDRFQNMLGTAMPVSFHSETSRVGQVTATPAYDPASGGPDQPGLGVAAQVFGTLGGYLPDDVPPMPGEVSATYVDLCSEPDPVSGLPMPRTHNPRDGVSTVIAIADGEESFTDLNGDGVYQLGEPFVDLAEPFVDHDDDGVQDAGEWFLDVNRNGSWDGPNGSWDPFTKIWTQTVVVYTGAPAGPFDTAGGDRLGSRWVDLADWTGDACTATPPAPPFYVQSQKELEDTSTDPPTKITIPPTTDSYVVVGSDWNLNLLSAATTYGVSLYEPTGIEVFFNGRASLPDARGFTYRYWPCDQDGQCATRCTATTTGPCEMRATVGGFGCGTAGGVVFKGGTEPTGAEAADYTSVLDPSELHLVLPGLHE